MFLYFIGGLTTLFLIMKVQLRLWRNFYTFILPKYLDNGPYLRSMGKWAVITGCTTGIGKEYAMKLAECGLHTVLISRSEDKLRAVSLEIEEKYNVQTKIVVADFLQGDHIYDHIRAELFNLDIGILVNNVGIRTPGRKNFLETPHLDKVVTDLVTVNVLSVPKMTSIVLPGMVKRQRGIVINVSSFVGRFQCKQFCLYGATKAFVCFLTKCLQKEYGENGIIFQNLTPWVISSQMTDYMPTSRILPDAKTYVDSSFRTIGYSDDTCGYLPHDIMAFIFSSRLAYLVSGFWLCLMAGKAKWQRIKTVYNWQ